MITSTTSTPVNTSGTPIQLARELSLASEPLLALCNVALGRHQLLQQL
jgi:hypothetical protein